MEISRFKLVAIHLPNMGYIPISEKYWLRSAYDDGTPAYVYGSFFMHFAALKNFDWSYEFGLVPVCII